MFAFNFCFRIPTSYGGMPSPGNFAGKPPPALPSRSKQISMFQDNISTGPPEIPEKGHRHTTIIGPSSPLYNSAPNTVLAPPKKEIPLPPKTKSKVSSCFICLFINFNLIYLLLYVPCKIYL